MISCVFKVSRVKQIYGSCEVKINSRLDGFASQTKHCFVYNFQEVGEMSKAVIIPECKKDVGGVKEGLSLSPNEKRDGAMGLFSRLLRLDTLKRSSVATKPEPQITYYGVYIPCEIKKGPDEGKSSLFTYNHLLLPKCVRRYCYL